MCAEEVRCLSGKAVLGAPESGTSHLAPNGDFGPESKEFHREDSIFLSLG